MRLHLEGEGGLSSLLWCAGSWSDSCQQRLLLAQYFSSPEDLWLRLHFYHSCADSEQGAASAPAMEAQAFLAEFYLQTGGRSFPPVSLQDKNPSWFLLFQMMWRRRSSGRS